MKTPEQMADEWARDWHKDCDYPEEILKHTIEATKTTFLAGYKAAQQWISVKERLPEIKPTDGMNYWLTSTCVLIATKEKTTHVAHLTHWTREPEADWAACACDTPGHDVEPERWKLSDVTHWQPLPEPPKEEI
jgi:hypothetical protein